MKRKRFSILRTDEERRNFVEHQIHSHSHLGMLFHELGRLDAMGKERFLSKISVDKTNYIAICSIEKMLGEELTMVKNGKQISK